MFSRAQTAILEPMAQNWLADDASQVEPVREPAVPPRRQLDDEADLEDAAVHATPTLTAGTATAGPNAYSAFRTHGRPGVHADGSWRIRTQVRTVTAF